MHQRRQQMWFHRKPSVRRLYPVARSHAPDLIGELPLLVWCSDMLDHGIAENDFERMVAKGQTATVPRNKPETIFAALLSAWHVQQSNSRPHTRQQPIRRCAAHVQDPCFFGDSEAYDKRPHAARPKSAHGASDGCPGGHTGR